MATTPFDESDSEVERRSTYAPDSDDESLINVDSPSDGYFANRGHPQATFVENPSRVEEDKAHEAADARPPSRPVPPSAQDRHPSRLDESAPLLDAGPAPPDYYQATGGRGVPPSPYARELTVNTSYGSISPSQARRQSRASDEDTNIQSPATFNSDHPLVRNGLFNEQGSPNQRVPEPESMRDQPPQPAPEMAAINAPSSMAPSNNALRQDTPDEEALPHTLPRWHRYYDPHSKKHHSRWRNCRRGLLRIGCLSILLVTVLVIAISILSTSGDNSNDNPHSRLPVDSPSDDGPPLPSHPDTAQCTYLSRSGYRTFDFYDPGNFSFLEMIEYPTFPGRLRDDAIIGGRVKISPFDANLDGSDDIPAIRVSVEAASTKPWAIRELKFVEDEDGFELGFPEVIYTSPGSEYGLPKPCLDFAVFIQVRQDVELQNWDLTTANLDIEVGDGIFAKEAHSRGRDSNDHEIEEAVVAKKKHTGLSITNDTSIDAIRGSINVAYWSSRRTHISTHSGSISGTYALRDLLEVDSHSGTIDIGVPPKEADDGDSSNAPADLIVKTHSGSVKVECPEDEFESDIPKRQYRTRVETFSSSLSGRYLLGTSASFTSHSGTIDVSVLPISTNAWKSSLYTKTLSSTTSLRLREALTTSSKSDMGSISSNHRSNSGSIDLKYPGHWTGKVEGRSLSGSIDVKGKDVEIIDDDHGPAYRKIRARKGDGDSLLTFKTLSSSVDVLIGDED